MSTVSLVFLIGLVLSPIFYVGYRVGYRRGLRAQGTASMPPAQLLEGLDWPVEITYTDYAKNRSQRRVTVQRVQGDDTDHPTHIEGYCHSRKQARTFRVANIQQLTDLSTGEVAKNPQTAIREKVKASL